MFFSRLRAVAGIAALLLTAASLHYSLPSRDVVRIVGTDVVRQDVERRDAQGNRVTVTRDVRFIYAKWPGGGDRVYRNQDTGWGWPPYFKFDSGDIAAEAKNYSVDGREKVVLVTYYGFRIRMLSAFPNILSMKTVPADYQVVPWFTIFFGLAHLVFAGVLVVLIRDFKEGREGKR